MNEKSKIQNESSGEAVKFDLLVSQPFYEDENIKIYNGDLNSVLPQLGIKADLILTDPPFNAGKEIENDNMNEQEFMSFTKRWLFTVWNNMKENSNIAVIFGVKYQKPLVECLNFMFNYNWEFIWWKSNGMLNGKATFAKYDKVFWHSKGESKHNRTDLIPTDVWNIPIKVEANNFGHPTPKDVSGLDKIITLLSNEGDLIIDPFMGSGSTLVSAKKLGRKAIGIDIEKRWCEVAVKRLAQYQLF